VRKAAYEEASQIFEKTGSEDDPAFRPFLLDSGLWKSAVADSNVAAHQEALAALCVFLKYGGRENGTRTRNNTVSTIVEKGLGSTRPAAKASALEALLLYVELDAAGPIIEEMLPALAHKQPKVIAACLAAITAIIHNYGCKIVDPKPVLKQLPKAFGHADKNVRAEATNMTVELYRWLKEAIKPMFWGDLKPTQQTDLEAQFEKVKGEPTPKQERLLRTQQEAMARAPAEGEEEEADARDDAEEPAEIDAFDLAEPKDVLKEMPDNFYDRLGSSKWKDRKEAVDELLQIINVPRIKDGDYHELNRGLAKCMKDANVTVVTQAAMCIEALAKGLRKAYGKYRATVMQPILERLKEKKATVADALGLALDAVFQATNLTDNLEDITAFLVHKNPQVKEGTMKFLTRCLRTTRDVPAKNEIASMVESAKKLLSESVETLRSGGAEILGTIMKIIGERAMKPHLDGLDDIRMNKIKECFDTVEVKAKDKPKPAPKPAAAAAPAKKPALGARKAPPGVKKPAPAAAAPAAAAAEAPPAAAPAKPPSKLGMARPGAIKAPGKRIGGPPPAASPKLAPAPSPSPTFDDEPALPPPQPRTGMGRGLTGRSLAKPGSQVQPAPPPSPPPSTGISAMERAELEELRTANEYLHRQIDDLRQDRSKLMSEVQELKNQNAGLIEDHTRDVLSIKAKETQLVRARSDAEAAEQTNERLRREMDRLKRALSRAEGLDGPAPRPGSGMDSPGRVTSPAMDEPTGGFRNSRYGDIATAGRNRMSFASNMSEDREGLNPAMAAHHYQQQQARVSPDPRYHGVGASSNSSGRASPAQGYRSGTSRYDDSQSVYSGDDRKPGYGGTNGAGSTAGGSNGGNVESWKRAAEVTSQLKARIEMMKVSLRGGVAGRERAVC
jgi:cytoskeleton-associated protein 5